MWYMYRCTREYRLSVKDDIDFIETTIIAQLIHTDMEQGEKCGRWCKFQLIVMLSSIRENVIKTMMNYYEIICTTMNAHHNRRCGMERNQN